MTSGGKGSKVSSCKPIFSTLPETNILNVVKVGKDFFCVFMTELKPFTFVVSVFKIKSLVFYQVISNPEISQQLSLC